MSLQIITANLLSSGDVVYLTPDETWSGSIADSLVLEKGDAANELLERAMAPGGQLVAVDPYLMDVDVRNGVPVPLSQREIIRAKGPTVHPQFARAQNADV